MKIEWDDTILPDPRRPSPSIWSKVKNTISVLKPEPPPGGQSRRRSLSPRSKSSKSKSPPRSSSRPPVQRSQSTSHSYYVQHQAPPHQGGGGKPQRPFVTISQNTNGVMSPISGNGQYGNAYVVQGSSPSPLVRSPTYSSRRPPTAARQSSMPFANSPSGMRTPSGTPPYRSSGNSTPIGARPPAARRSSTPASPIGGAGGGVMYNGKMIVGDPDDVHRYINSQKTIEGWRKNIR